MTEQGGHTAWTEERVALLTRLRLAGQSASQIAKALNSGHSRNAVIGKCIRLGLTSFREPSAPGRAVTPKPRRSPSRYTSTPPKPNSATRALLGAPSGQSKPPRPIAPTVEDVTHAKPWPQRGFGECAWPIGEPSHDMLSCCAPTLGETYCPHHARVRVQPPQPKSKSGAAELARSLRRYI